MPKAPLKLRVLLKRLTKYGIVRRENKRGKGSEIILQKPVTPSSGQGPMFPLKNHGDNTEISFQTIMAILRRFNIDPNDFWE